MSSALGARLKHAWNAFLRDPTDLQKANYTDFGQSFIQRPDRLRLTRGPDKTIIASIYNRIAMDVAAVKIEHVIEDEEGRYIKSVNSPLNQCLTVEANIDQTGRTFVQDAVITMLDTGCVALVPTVTDISPMKEDSTFEIHEIRNAKIQEWYPRHVKIDIYNDKTGLHTQFTMPKTSIAIIENPFYPVMNEPNSTMQRLIRKLTLLDAIDEQTGSGKLDMIIQLPYVIRTDERRRQAEKRRTDIETQLTKSKYGIAYTDGTEKIIQLNKPLENNLLSTIEFLTTMLYSQLGITAGILDGTADEQTMLNYNNRIIEPILSVITDEMKRKFLTKTARSRRHSIKFFRDPFRLVPISNLADIADRFTRNEIMTSNEFRQEIGLKPADDPNADELRNKNMPIQDQPGAGMVPEGIEDEPSVEENSANLDNQLDELEALLGHSALYHYLPTPSSYASKYYDPEKAHEYYMKNRTLKGRESTASLNEEGKKVAAYVKKSIYDERNQKLDSHSADVNKQYKELRDKRQEDLGDARARATAAVESSQGILSKRSELAGEISENKIQSLQNQRDQEIKETQANTQRGIDSLRRELENMTPEQREARSDEIQRKIDQLRNENDATKAEIEEGYASSSAKTQNTEAKAREQAQKKFDVTEETARKVQEGTQTIINNNYHKSVADLIKTSKAEKAKIVEDYTEKWLTELDRIKTIPEYLKAKKTGSGRSGGRTSSKKEKASASGPVRKSRTPIEYNNSLGNNERYNRIKKVSSTAKGK